MIIHPVNTYYATEQIVHIFDSIYNIRLNVIQDKVDIIRAKNGAWAVILKAIAFFAKIAQNLCKLLLCNTHKNQAKTPIFQL